MNLKEVFGYWNNILLLNSSERFPSSCLSNVKVLLLALSLDIDIENPPPSASPRLHVWKVNLCKLKCDRVISILKSNAIVSQG